MPKTKDTLEDQALAALGLKAPPDADDDTLIDGEIVTDDQGQPIPDELTFTTPEPDEDEPEPESAAFRLDGKVYYAYKPSDGQWTMLLSSLDPHATVGQRANAVLSFIQACVDEPTWMLLHHRLTDRADKFDVNVLADVVTALINRWGKDKAGNRATRRRARRGK